MFEKLLNKMNLFDDNMKKAYEEYDKERKKVLSNYKGEKLEEKLKDLSQNLKNTENTLKSDLMEDVENEFNLIKLKWQCITEEPANSDLQANLEVIRLLGKNISDNEIQAYIEKYKGNYLSCLGVVETLHSMGTGHNLVMFSAGIVKDKIDTCHNVAVEFVRTYIPGSLSSAMVLDAKSSVLASIGSQINPFFEKTFVTKHKSLEG